MAVTKQNKQLSPDEERLYEIFRDLQNDRKENGKTINLIGKNRKLTPNNKAFNFQGDRIRKQINYNPDYYRKNVAKYNDNLLRFILLHEEAHITRSKNKLPYFVYIHPIS